MKQNRSFWHVRGAAAGAAVLLAVGLFTPAAAWAAGDLDAGDDVVSISPSPAAPKPSDEPVGDREPTLPEQPQTVPEERTLSEDSPAGAEPSGEPAERPSEDAVVEESSAAASAANDSALLSKTDTVRSQSAPAAADVIAALVPTPPAAASDAALIAWVGDVEPATKITLQAALNAVPDGGTVGIVPGDYKFTTQLQVQRSTTISAASTTTIYARFVVNAGGLTASNLALAPFGAKHNIVSVANTAADVSLSNLVITNATSDGSTPFAGVVAINLGSSVGTRVLQPNITDVATAIGLAGSTAARIEDATVVGVATGASITAANANAGPVFVGGSMTLTGSGISLGSTVAPSVSGMTLAGSGAGTGVHVNLATAASVTDVSIDGFVSGVLLASVHAGAGPSLSNSQIGASLTGVDLGASTDASLSNVTVSRTGAGTAASNSTGVNMRQAAGVEVGGGTQVSGFARGIHADDTSTAIGPEISDTAVTARVIGINLGATAAPSVVDTEVTGQGATGITDGIRVLMATDAEISGVTVTGFTRGIYTDGNNTGAGPTIAESTIAVVNVKAFGITLGATTDATVTDVDVSGTGELPQTGITVARAPGAVVTDARVSNVTVGIGATRVTPGPGVILIEGPRIIRPVVTDSGSGIQVASSIGAVIEDAELDVTGDGINGWETEDVLITSPHVVGVPGPGPTDGTNSIRFYTSRGVTVNDAVLEGGASALYWDMTYDVVVDNADITGMEWYASYSESVTGYELRNSTIHDNAAIANLTINPSDQPFGNLRQVSSDISWHDNTFTGNPAGIYLPLGVMDFEFLRNVVTGSDRYVFLASPVHGFTVEDNDIDFSPATPTAAAISVTTLYEDLNEPGSYSSSGLSVTSNDFTGAGPFIRIGAVESVPDGAPVNIELPAAEPPDSGLPSEPSPEPEPQPDPDLETASAPASLRSVVILQVPADRRAVRSTMDVSLNSFPQDSIAIVTLPNAETGEDASTENEMIDGRVAVDAREENLPGQNDWGSECGPRVAATGYDGGGAFIEEERTTQVLYPELCVGPEPSVTVAATVVCRADLGYLDYDIGLVGIPADPTPVVAVIWWAPDVYPQRDATIPAADEAAILDDGADAVQYVPVPDDWQPDDPLVGEFQVADALVDADGAATRDTWTLEVRVNPSAAISIDPPTGLALCPVAPPESGSASGLAASGGSLAPLLPVLGLLIASLGVGMLAIARRRAAAARAGAYVPRR